MRIAAASVAALLLLASGEASAAPQILALMNTDGPKLLECGGGLCRAEFTTMCLQEHRKVPLEDTAYELLPGDQVTVHLHRADGKEIKLAASAAGVSARAIRRQAATELAIPHSVLAAHGAAAASLSVSRTAFLMPKPVQGDDDPITAAETRAVVGQHVAVAAAFEKDVAAGLATTRLLSDIINALPPGRIAKEKERAAAEAVFARAAVPDGPARRAREDVRSVFETCDTREIRAVYKTARTCLQWYHDNTVVVINTAYWKRVTGKGG